MKSITVLITAVLCLAQAACIGAKGGDVELPTPAGVPRPVIVELFTSEGCSSCPPADKQLEFLSKQQPVTDADIITLAFHVDYWDSASWKDQFSSPLFSQRQELYTRQLKLDSAYTPQIVVGGRRDLVGTDFSKALLAIMESAKAPAGIVRTVVTGETVKIDVAELPQHEQATMYVAATEDELSSKVSGGENAGSKFRHMSVVRELIPVSVVGPGESAVSTEVQLPYSPVWKKENVKYVAFVQDNADRKIIAAGRIAR